MTTKFHIEHNEDGSFTVRGFVAPLSRGRTANGADIDLSQRADLAGSHCEFGVFASKAEAVAAMGKLRRKVAQ